MKMNIGVVIGRYIDGGNHNELEYISDENKSYRHFASENEARQYLQNQGIHDENKTKNCYVFQYHTFCLNCGKEYFLAPSETFVDGLGRGYYCHACDGSFDVI